MIDPFVVLTPVLVLAVMALTWFIGCYSVVLLPVPSASYRQGGAPFENFQGGNNASISTNPFTDKVPEHDLMVVWIFYESNTQTVSTVTDSAGSTYTRAVGPEGGTNTGANGLANWQQEIWYAIIAEDATNLAITANFTNAFAGKKAISPHDFNTGSFSLSLDQKSEANGTSGTGSTAFATPPVTDSEAVLVFAAAIFGGPGGTSGSGFTPVSTLQLDVAEYEIPTASTTNFAGTFTSNGSQEWIAQMVTFG